MGIYIPGMDMPTGNPEEPTAVWVYPDGSVKAFYNCGNNIMASTAAHVPPHGRLIDADALEKLVIEEKSARRLSAYGSIKELHKSWGLHDAELMIEAATTIIPPEK